MTPPQLTGDTPVVYILHPAGIGLGEALRNKLDLALVDDTDCILCERCHLDEPLCGGNRLDNRTAAVAGADIVLVILDLNQGSCCIQICDDLLAAFHTVKTLVLAAVFIDGGIVVEYQNLLQIMALTHLEVVRVMARRNLNAAGTELHLNVLVCEDRDLTVHQRQNRLLADQMGIALIVRVDGYTGIAHIGLRTGGCDNQGFIRARNRIADVPQLAVLLLVLNLGIRQRRDAVRAPVDDTAALIDQPLVVKVDKYFLNRLGTSLVHGEALTAPVTGGTQLLELLDNAVAVLLLPCPDALEELLAAKVIAGQSLLLAQVLLNLDLGCNACVVGARHPQCGIALHTLGTDQDILQGLVKCVTHVQLSGNIWGRNYNGIWLFVLIYFSVEVSVLLPEPIELVFGCGRVIGLWQFVCHEMSLPSINTI